MSETTALISANQMTISEVMTIGKTMASSGYFQDAKQAAQAVVKILAGREMGFGPFASMTGINIIKGKPAIGGNLMAAAVKAHHKYDYQVVVLDADTCELAFFEGAKELGRSIFTKEDAKAAEVGRMIAKGVSGSMMTRFARNMLFNRAMSNGVRWYCPDVFLGSPVYTPDELGAQLNASGDIIDLTPTTVTKRDNGSVDYEDKAPHWIEQDNVRKKFWAWARSDLSLNDDQVHEALDVKSVKDFAGTMDQAKAWIEAWVKAQSETADAGGAS